MLSTHLPSPLCKREKIKDGWKGLEREKKHSKGEREEENVIFSQVLEHSFQKLEGRESIYIKGKLMVREGMIGIKENEGGLDIIVSQETLYLFYYE